MVRDSTERFLRVSQQQPCEFTIKKDYLMLGRLCQIDNCFCAHWGKPLIFAECPVRTRALSKMKELEALETT